MFFKSTKINLMCWTIYMYALKKICITIDLDKWIFELLIEMVLLSIHSIMFWLIKKKKYFLIHTVTLNYRQWFIYNFWLMGPGTRCFQYQLVPTANLWVLNTNFNDKSAILLHPGTPRNKNLCAKDARCAGIKITVKVCITQETGHRSLLYILGKMFCMFSDIYL